MTEAVGLGAQGQVDAGQYLCVGGGVAFDGRLGQPAVRPGQGQLTAGPPHRHERLVRLSGGEGHVDGGGLRSPGTVRPLHERLVDFDPLAVLHGADGLGVFASGEAPVRFGEYLAALAAQPDHLDLPAALLCLGESLLLGHHRLVVRDRCLALRPAVGREGDHSRHHRAGCCRRHRGAQRDGSSYRSGSVRGHASTLQSVLVCPTGAATGRTPLPRHRHRTVTPKVVSAAGIPPSPGLIVTVGAPPDATSHGNP